MMNTRLKIFALICLLLFICGCSGRIIQAPIEPYVNPDVNRFPLTKVAVMPFVVPSYMKMESGAENISIEMTNMLISGLSSKRVFGLMQTDLIKAEIDKVYPSSRDWIFNGNISDAVKIAKATQADGVIFCKVSKYLQGNMVDSEVEIEVILVETSTGNTIWSIRELVLGKGGPEVFVASTQPVATARACSISAIDSTLEKIEKIHRTGGPITVSKMSPKQITGYSLVSAGIVFTGISGYYFSESLKYYNNYENAGNDYDLAKFREKTQQSDTMWQIWGGVGVVTLGTGIYLLVTDYQKVASGKPPGIERRFAVTPRITPGGAGVSCMFRF